MLELKFYPGNIQRFKVGGGPLGKELNETEIINTFNWIKNSVKPEYEKTKNK